MKRVYIVHNRPNDNDCLDEFIAETSREAARQGVYLWYCRWDEDKPTSVDEDNDVMVTFVQDPIGPRKQRVLEKFTRRFPEVLNHPSNVNNARRDLAYPIWRSCGLCCPRPPENVYYDTPLPFIAKDIGKQIGKGFLIDSDKRREWLWEKSKRFYDHPEKFRALDYIDLRAQYGGYHPMHRYVVCRDIVVPVVFAKTKNWNCKATHMTREMRKWTDAQLCQFRDELDVFWNTGFQNVAAHDAALAVSTLGLDFALVDGAIIKEGLNAGRLMLFEVNPYMNLRTAANHGKREVWWPPFAKLLGFDLPIGKLDANAYIKELLDWKGYHLNWRKVRDAATKH